MMFIEDWHWLWKTEQLIIFVLRNVERTRKWKDGRFGGLVKTKKPKRFFPTKGSPTFGAGISLLVQVSDFFKTRAHSCFRFWSEARVNSRPPRWKSHKQKRACTPNQVGPGEGVYCFATLPAYPYGHENLLCRREPASRPRKIFYEDFY